MREHTRANGRYMRSEAGDLVMDWGSNGADYNALDFSYVVKGKSGNLSKIYGQVRRGEDGRTYSTYDIKAGNKRLKTTKSESINRAIRKHIKEMSGIDVVNLDTKSKMPLVPNTIRDAVEKAISGHLKSWDYFWRGEDKFLGEEEKAKIRECFAQSVSDSSKFFCEPVDGGKFIAVGLMNIDVRENMKLYKAWREYIEDREARR